MSRVKHLIVYQILPSDLLITQMEVTVFGHFSPVKKVANKKNISGHLEEASIAVGGFKDSCECSSRSLLATLSM